uniref:Tyr recombinase domain-containing protein n=1 Tax=Amphimedon queenslandica TaxID=400682 RepID=A0A1X7THF4_AMPQE
MFVKAKLNVDGVHNHSLRATSVSRMYERGVAEKSIMDQSGHLSLGGIRTYERISEKTKMEVSNLLSNTDFKVKEETPPGPLQPLDDNRDAGADENKKQLKANEKFFHMQGCTVNITFNN